LLRFVTLKSNCTVLLLFVRKFEFSRFQLAITREVRVILQKLHNAVVTQKIAKESLISKATDKVVNNFKLVQRGEGICTVYGL
jgi:hypothetical protein